MGVIRKALLAVVGMGFLAAAANVAYLQATGTSDAAYQSAIATPGPTPEAPGPVESLLTPILARVAHMTSTTFASIPPAPAALPIPVAVPTPTPAPAQADAAFAQVEVAWRAWMDRNGIAAGAMAIALPDGRVISAAQDYAPDQTAPVASLSKAITGICLDQILSEQGLPWSTRLADIATGMSAAGVTPRAWNQHITLSGLATHTAGLSPDLTQGDLMGRLHGALGLHRRVASDALRQEALLGNPGSHFYSNTNYAVLGVVIEALSGQTYTDACMTRVMEPAGIDDAVIHGRMGSMSSYAGWEISAESYARLARYWFRAGRPAIDLPDLRPQAGSYAIGYMISGEGRDAVISHNGRLCRDRETRDGFGATFVALGHGTAFAATWQDCVPSALYDELTREIERLLR